MTEMHKPDPSEPSNDIRHNTAILHQQIQKFQQQNAHCNNDIAKRVWQHLSDRNSTLVDFSSFVQLLTASIRDWPELETSPNWLADRWIIDYFNSDQYIIDLRSMVNKFSLKHDITKPVKWKYIMDFVRITNNVFYRNGSRAKFIASLHDEIQEKGENLVAFPETFSFNGVKLLNDRYHRLGCVFTFNSWKEFPILEKLLINFNSLQTTLDNRVQQWSENTHKWMNDQKDSTSTTASTVTSPTPMDENDTLFFEIYSILDDLQHLKPIMVNLLHSIQILSRLGVGPVLIFPTPSTLPVKVALQFLSEEELSRINHTPRIHRFEHNSRKPHRSYTQTLASKSAIAS